MPGPVLGFCVASGLGFATRDEKIGTRPLAPAEGTSLGRAAAPLADALGVEAEAARATSDATADSVAGVLVVTGACDAPASTTGPGAEPIRYAK